MYTQGRIARQILGTIEDIYGYETSVSFIADMMDKTQPLLKSSFIQQM